MSSYHIHLSDDSGYALPSAVFPNLTSPHLALSLGEWETLVDTAVQLGLGRIVALYHRPSTFYQIH